MCGTPVNFTSTIGVVYLSIEKTRGESPLNVLIEKSSFFSGLNLVFRTFGGCVMLLI